MSRFWLPALACACALTLTAPVFATDAKPPAQKKPDPAAVLTAKLKETAGIEGSKIGEMSLVEVLQSLGKKHDVTFVILEEQFKAKKLNGIKDRKSRVQKLDAKGMTLAEFLDAWLPGLGATYKVREDYIEVVPLLRTNAEVKEDAKPTAKLVVTTELILEMLAQDFHFRDNTNVRDIPLIELLEDASKKYHLTFIINEEAFKSIGLPNVKEATPTVTSTQLRGLTVHQFLTVVLDSLGATYLVKNNAIEIVPTDHAAKLTKSRVSQDESGRTRLDEPLVSAVCKEKPLNEAAAKIAEMYDLTVIVAPQAGEGRTGPVTARMLNVPADKALELLALQADLRVVRKGNAFLITSKDHAFELFNEKLDRQREKIELQKSREAPPAKQPQPPQKP